MANFLIVLILLIIVGAAIAYIVKEKKRGVKCIGCPAAGSCSHNCQGSGCSGNGENHCDCHTDTKA